MKGGYAMNRRELKNNIGRFATDVEDKAHAYALAGKEKLESTLRRGRQLVLEKKADIVSTIEKEKNRLIRWH
jgi:hypothetical protein